MSDISRATMDEKRRLLAELLARREAASKETSFGVSHGQQGLWFQYQLAPKAYNNPLVLRIRSAFERKALQAAVQSLADRHDLLRAVFTYDKDRLTQRIEPTGAVPYEEERLSEAQRGELDDRLLAESSKPFDLEKGPIFRAKLFWFSDQDAYLLLNTPHIVSDGISKGVITEELVKLYEAANSGIVAALPPVGARYSAFVRWQSEMLSGEEGKKLFSYWQDRLGGEIPLLNLPADKLRPAVQSDNGGRESLALAPAAARALMELAAGAQVTPYTLFLAAFQAFLCRYTGQQDIVVGSSMTGAGRRRFPRVVGYFINMVALRGDLSGDPTFRELLTRTHRVVSEAIDNQEYPLSLLVQKLKPFQDPSLSPFFQTSFTYHKRSSFLKPGTAPSALAVSRHDVQQGAGQYDLNLRVTEEGESLALILQYNQDLFQPSTIRRMGQHLLRWLEGIAASPATPLSRLALLSDEEKRPIPFEWEGRETQANVLGRGGEPLPVGVIGELAVARDGAMAATGVAARRAADGRIETLGPAERLWNVRGLVVDKAAVERAIEASCGCARCFIALRRDDGAGSRRVVAYLEGGAGAAAGGEDSVRALLQGKLPKFMIPDAFARVERLALDAEGQVDVEALPAPTAKGKTGSSEGPRNPTEELLASIWRQTLGIPTIGIHDRLFELGGDSILALQVVMKLNQAGLNLTLHQIYKHQTIAELAEVAGSSTVQADQGIVTGAVPLTPIEHWFVGLQFPQPQNYSLTAILEAQAPLDPGLVERAAWYLLRHHDALRMRLVKEGSSFQQFVADIEETAPFSEIDLSAVPEAEQLAARDARLNELSAGLDLENGPINQVALLTFGGARKQQVVLLAHHIAVDTISMGILCGDFNTIYQQLNQGEEVSLPAKTTSFKAWSERLLEHTTKGGLAPQLEYWRGQCESRGAGLPKDNPAGQNPVDGAQTLWSALDPRQTQALLRDVPRAQGAHINDVLLAGLVTALCRLSKRSAVLIDLEGHGREPLFDDLDISRTVGWFTTIFPVLLPARKENALDNLPLIKEALAGVPSHGAGYGLLRYLSREASDRSRLSIVPDVRFNYMSQQDQIVAESALFKPVREVKRGALVRGKGGRLSHPLVIHARVVNGCFQAGWTFGDQFSKETIAALAKGFEEALESMAADRAA